MEVTIVLKPWMWVPAVQTALIGMATIWALRCNELDTDSAGFFAGVWVVTAGCAILTGLLA